MSPLSAADTSSSWSSYVRICNFTDKENWILTVPEEYVHLFKARTFDRNNEFSLPTGNFALLEFAKKDIENKCQTTPSVPVTIYPEGYDVLQGTTYEIFLTWDEDNGICRPNFGETSPAYQPANYVTATTRLMMDDEIPNSQSVILSVCRPEVFQQRTYDPLGASCPFQKANDISWFYFPSGLINRVML
eukprot:Clim_evm1s14 gene=Clim_evmTU1s14